MANNRMEPTPYSRGSSKRSSAEKSTSSSRAIYQIRTLPAIVTVVRAVKGLRKGVAVHAILYSNSLSLIP